MNVLVRQRQGESAVDLTSAEARRGLSRALIGEVQHAKALVYRFKAQLRDLQPGPEYIAALADAMDESEAAISAFKARQRGTFEQLAREEELLSRELESASARLQGAAWEDAPPRSERPKAAAPQAVAPATASTTASTTAAEAAGPSPGASAARKKKQGGRAPRLAGRPGLAPEILEFEAFADKFGETGGWEEEDHLAFQRLVRACKSDYKVVAPLALEEFPGKSAEDVQSHCQWDAMYKRLLFKKKVAIEAWRKRKTAERASKRVQAGDDVAAPSARRAKQAAEAQSAARDEATQHKRALVAEWKAKKVQQRAEERAALLRNAELKRAQAEAADKRRREQNAVLLAQYKEQKQQEQALEQAKRVAEATSRRPRPVDHSKFEENWERDKALIAKKKFMQTKRARELAGRAKRQAEISSEVTERFNRKVDRDPARLTRPTKVLEIRNTMDTEEKRLFSQPSGFIRHVGGRVKPSWRQGL